MEYIQDGMCDNSKIYKFENFKASTQPPTKRSESSSRIDRKTTRNMRSSSKNTRNLKDNESRGVIEERSSIGSCKDNPNEENKSKKKRILKMNRKNLNMLDDYQASKEAQRKAKKLEIQNPKVFKVKKMENKRDSCQESSYNISSEEQKNNMSNLSNGYKIQNNGSNTDSNISTRVPTNYLCLSSGKVIIKGNEIETTVPCDIETINNKVSMISPHYPVRVIMSPLLLNQPHVYNPKSQSFTSKESNQSGQINGDLPSTFSSSFDSYIRILEQSY
jgi:hypothetical protein